MSSHCRRQKRIHLSSIAISLVGLVFTLGVSLSSVVALPSRFPMRSFYSAQPVATEPAASQSGKDGIVIRVAMPAASSIRDQRINTKLFLLLLRDRASREPDVKPCQLEVHSSDQFPNLDLTMSHPSSAQRLDCFRGAIRYILREHISETDFLAARATEADATRRWTEPHPRYLGLAESATERLAYLAIYQKYSPLFEIHSVGVKDITELSFDAFSLWLRRMREEKLIAFDARASLLEALDLPARSPMILVPAVSLSSLRVPPGVLFFDGERFAIPALIMVSLDIDDAVPDRRIDQEVRNRFSCNWTKPPRLEEDAATGAISKISCFSHWVFGDTWLGLAVRKSDGSDYRDFCRQVRELAADKDVAALVRDTPERSRGLYVLLPSKCKTQE